MKKISKVKNVQANGTWDSNYGTLYQFDYEMENGEALQANHKTQDGFFKVGSEVEYEIKGQTKLGNNYGSVGLRKDMPYASQHGNRASHDKPKDYTHGIEVGHAINNAVNLVCAGVIFDGVEYSNKQEQIYLYAKQVMAIAERMKKE